MPQLQYCSIVDDHAELGPDGYGHVGVTFADSFCTQLFLQGDFAVTDAYFYAHKRLRKLRKDILLPCLRHGAIKPFFSNPANVDGSFVKGLADQRDRVRIAVDADEAWIRELDHELRDAEGYQPKIWPPAVGLRFRDTVLERVSSPTEPSTPHDPGAVKLWSDTETYRTSWIQKAIGRTGDLQRSQVVQVIAEEICEEANKDKKWATDCGNDAVRVFDALPKESPRRNHIEHFYTWILHCYHSAQAEAFGVRSAFFPCTGYKQLVPFAQMQNEERSEIEIAQVWIRFPNPERLLREGNIEKLLNVRKNEGSEYFDALEIYQKSEISEDAESRVQDVLKRLNTYTDVLSRTFGEDTTIVGAFLPKHPGVRLLLKAATEVVVHESIHLLTGITPPPLPFVHLSEACYEFLPPTVQSEVRVVAHQIVGNIEWIPVSLARPLKVSSAATEVVPLQEDGGPKPE